MHSKALFKIKKQLLDQDKSISKNEFEVCGIISGRKKGNEYIASKIYIMENKIKSFVRFEIDNDNLYQIYRKIESYNESVIGIYHSHPSHPIPSKTDLEYMKINPIPWLIKSTTENQIRCFIYIDNEISKDIIGKENCYKKFQEIVLQIMD